MAVSIGVLGVYSMYCAFDQCGNNKALAIIISYCVPSVIVMALSIFVLHETYNIYAYIGVLCIIVGVILIDGYGIYSSDSTMVHN